MQRSDLMCDVRTIWYDFNFHTGTLYMANNNCCDMKGCIDLFLKIDPDVWKIETVSGDERDTVYARNEFGHWRATEP